jgi:hypothetical protein
MESFKFIRDYDLIRITDHLGDQYAYEKYTGQKVTEHLGQLEAKDDLRSGWFYLSRQDQKVLSLHPLLIFWSEKNDVDYEADMDRDAAVYNRFLKRTVEYLATVIWCEVQEEDEELISKFTEIIDNLQYVIGGRGQRNLSWLGIKEVCQEISDIQMSGAQRKYRNDLYLQRNDIFKTFLEFLQSKKRCFVLTGKSGVGKSNFVLSLLDEFSNDDGICLLLYNGSSLNIEGELRDYISNDLSQRFRLGKKGGSDIFQQLEDRGITNDKQLLIVFDAINEHAEPTKVLRSIDKLVCDIGYPWIKILVTSRPQAWRTMKRGLQLSEGLYFKQIDTEEHWVELEGFTVQLEDFNRDELHHVYENYRQAYGIQNDYTLLKSSIRETLRDPLILRLVAEIYKGGSIPDQLRVNDIYEQYVQRLIQTDRLRVQDIIFLEQELMPLMIFEDHYENKITASQINQAKTTQGKPLWELIHSDDLLSNGMPVNASYSRLSDAEIIIEQGPPLDYEITFKYERFYDYYGGRRLRVMLGDKVDIPIRIRAYQRLVTAMRTSPYLWGAVRTSLFEDLKDPEHDLAQLIIELAQTTDQLTKDLIVSVLFAFGQDDKNKVENICHQLLSLEQDASAKQDQHQVEELYASVDLPAGDQMTDLVSRYLQSTVTSQVHMAKKAAIEVGYQLRLTKVLITAANDSDSAVRAVDTQYIYYLWRVDQDEAFKVLDTLSKQFPGKWRIPNTKIIEVCLGVSLMILFFHFADVDHRTEFLLRLQSIWKRAIDYLLFIRPGESSFIAWIKNAIREVALYFGVRISISTVGRAEESGAIFSLPEVMNFFPASEVHKDMFSRLIPQANAVYEECEKLSDLDSILNGLMKERDLLTSYTGFLALLANVIGRPEESLPVIQEMFDYGLKNPPPPSFPDAPLASPMMPILVWCIRNMLYGHRYSGEPLSHDEISPELLDVYAEFIWNFETHYGSWCSTDIGKYRVIEASSYTYFYYLRYGEVESDLLSDMIDKAIEENDNNALIYHTIGFSSIGTHPAWRGAKAAAQSLHFILRKMKPTGLTEKLSAPIILAFANLQSYHPYIVDDLLAELSDEELPPSIKRVIQGRGATESLGVLLGTAGAWFVRDLLVDKNPQARELVMWIFNQAANSRSMSDWSRKLLKKIVNYVYGEQIFRLVE